MLSQEELFHRHRATLKRDLTLDDTVTFFSHLFSLLYSCHGEFLNAPHATHKRKDKFKFSGNDPEYILFYPYADSLFSDYKRKAPHVSDTAFFRQSVMNVDKTFIYGSSKIQYLLRQWTLPDGTVLFPAFIVKAAPRDFTHHYLQQSLDREQFEQKLPLKARYPFFEDSYSEFTLEERVFTDKFRPVFGYNHHVLYPVTFEEVKPFLPYLDHSFQQEPQTLPNPLSLPDF